jgi:hypothetical protein
VEKDMDHLHGAYQSLLKEIAGVKNRGFSTSDRFLSLLRCPVAVF